MVAGPLGVGPQPRDAKRWPRSLPDRVLQALQVAALAAHYGSIRRKVGGYAPPPPAFRVPIGKRQRRSVGVPSRRTIDPLRDISSQQDVVKTVVHRVDAFIQ